VRRAPRPGRAAAAREKTARAPVPRRGRARRLARARVGSGAYLLSVGGQPTPQDILLLLRDDIHRHEHVERVVYAPARVMWATSGFRVVVVGWAATPRRVAGSARLWWAIEAKKGGKRGGARARSVGRCGARLRMFFSSYAWSRALTISVAATANSATSSSATSLYVVRPFCSTFSHTFIEKWRSPLSPCLPPCARCVRFFFEAGSVRSGSHSSRRRYRRPAPMARGRGRGRGGRQYLRQLRVWPAAQVALRGRWRSRTACARAAAMPLRRTPARPSPGRARV
jgi:hypothetical protein